MNLKQLTSNIVFIFLVVCVAGLLFISSLLLYAPRYLENKLIPEIARDTGFNIISLNVRNVGVRGAELSDIRIGKDQEKGLMIDSIRIDYSLSGILSRIIDSVTISGLSLTFEYLEGNLSISGLDDLFGKNEADNSEIKNSPKPVFIQNLKITNSKARFIYNSKSINIPFDLSTASFNQYNLPKEMNLKLFPEEHEIIINGKTFNDNRLILSLTSDDFSLGLLENFLIDYVPLDLKGKADLRFSSELLPETFELSNISASLIFDSLKIKYSGVALKNPAESTPIELFIESENAVRWRYQCSPVMISNSSQSLETDFEGNFDLSGDAVNAEIMAKTVSADYDKLPAIIWKIYASQEKEAPLNIKLKGMPDSAGISQAFQIEAQGLTVKGESPEIEVDAEYDETGIISSYRLTLKKLKAQNNKMNFSAPLVSIEGKAEYVQKKGGQAGSSFSIESSNIVFNGYDLTAKIQGAVIKGSIEYDKSGIHTDARFFLNNGIVSGSDNPFMVKGLSGSIPFIWPLSKEERKGELSIETLSYEGYSAGPLNAEYIQKLDNISVNGKLLLPLFPDMNIDLSAVASLDPVFEKGRLHVQIPSYEPANDIDLKKFISELEGTYLNGEFEFNSNIGFSSSGLKGEAILEVRNGRVSNPENKMLLEEIMCDLKITDLFSMTSAPGQKLKIKNISYGNINASDFNMDFRIDRGTSLAVEQGGFKWADGETNIKPFKIIPGKDEYDITLFCDRLKLAEILDQFGVAEASGSGTVNGKIPLKILKGEISFQDGFLYSTPGGGGKINITETDILTAGLSPGSPEYTQMDIAREALKAFEYSWAKMTLNSERDELVMQLQFDGKPENKLPFKYKKEIGSFIRVDAEAEGSNFQGIRLDVNFRVPLNEILNYKDLLNMIK